MTRPRPGLPPAYILAGGRSSRFGSDKARHPHEGVPLILRVAGELAARGLPEAVVVADRAGRYEDLGLRTIADPTPHAGPLGGVLAALRDGVASKDSTAGSREDSRAGWRLVVACDGVGFDPRIATALLHALEEAEGAPPPRVLAIGFRAEREHPLPGLYRACAEAEAEIERRLREGRGSLRGLVEDRGRWIDWSGPWPMRNANRPTDLESG